MEVKVKILKDCRGVRKGRFHGDFFKAGQETVIDAPLFNAFLECGCVEEITETPPARPLSLDEALGVEPEAEPDEVKPENAAIPSVEEKQILTHKADGVIKKGKKR